MIDMSRERNKPSDKDLEDISTEQEMYKDIILEEEWLQLIDKHELRYEIWALLKL